MHISFNSIVLLQCILFGFMTGCGDLKESGGISGGENAEAYEKECGPAPGDETNARIHELEHLSEKTRIEAVAETRKTTGYFPLIAQSGYIIDNETKLADFPYPNALLIQGTKSSKIDLTLPLWDLASHSTEALKIYETEEGSGEYFLFDIVGGDGAGSSGFIGYGADVDPHGADIKKEDVASWHNWHINQNGELQRLYVTAEITLEQEIFVCGCEFGGDGYDIEEGSIPVQDAMVPAYRYGIFMLSKSVELPRAAESKLEVNYKKTTIQVNYVPKKGKRCDNPDFVC